MDRLKKCAEAYNDLLDVEYNFIIGRKGNKKEIKLKFAKEDFHHLVGLHKIKDIEQIRSMQRRKIFDSILMGKITEDVIKKSAFYHQMNNRINPLTYLEVFLDSNDCIIKYDKNRNIYSLIEADYLICGEINTTEVYLFIDENEERHFCRTFFPKDRSDYAQNQAKYTLLKKTKTRQSTNLCEVLYVRDGFNEK